MKEFKSKNNLTMVESKLFNWRKESIYHGKDEPYCYVIDAGGLSEMYSLVYNPKEKELNIGRVSFNMEFVARFFCEDIYSAESIVAAFIKGNSLEMKGTIYFKKN